ncbi:hypothetical protein PCASD_08938 [Puccinia coronata f. sp. avenae]|uniref:Uncharacterized protein n=1 Tax=Puccinia coronata f. sp. avenae TaxID=200324 RepID=A0A2N5UMT3_9BASI|nr:hypothetical protein PCASD_08938 [Puccinia coronata f. sp. avenae]
MAARKIHRPHCPPTQSQKDFANPISNVSSRQKAPSHEPPKKTSQQNPLCVEIGPPTQPNPAIGQMPFCKYEKGVKVIVVRLRLRGKTLAKINRTIGLKISNDSLRRWMTLYQNTRDVVRNPALYKPRGRPLAFSRDEAKFVLTALDEDLTLYLDEIQSHIEAMTGT